MTEISDHLPCFANFDFRLYTKDQTRIVYKHPTTLKYTEELCQNIAEQNIHNLLDKSAMTDPNINYDILESTIVSAMDKIMPLKRLKFKKYKHKKQPWITNGILKSIKYKDRSLKLTPCNTLEFIDKKANLRVFKSILCIC